MNNFAEKERSVIKGIFQLAFNLKYLMVLMSLFVASNFLVGQGSIPIKAKSFIGALEFLPNGKLADGYSRVKMALPNEKDPAIDPDKWYTDGNNNMRGMIGDAVLFLEWWPLGYSPAERYKFDWISSGYFELYNVSDNPLAPIKRISRSDLIKYPNLLKRFDNITPIDIQFEFTFRTADLPDQEYNNFRKRYKIFESLGSAGYSVSFTRKLDGDFILYKASRKKQDWINPGPIQGGWDTFLNVPENLEDKKSRLIELFKMGRSLVFSNFKITRIKWNMSDFKYIAQKYADYESGKDKPTAFDEVEKGVKENKAGDEFWDETDLVDSEMEVYQEGHKFGLKSKKGSKKTPAIYKEILSTSKKGIFLAQKDNGVAAINSSGIELAQLVGDYVINANFKGRVNGEYQDREYQAEYERNWIKIFKSYEFVNNQFVFKNNYVINRYHSNYHNENYYMTLNKKLITKAQHQSNWEKARGLTEQYISQGYLKW